MEKQRSFSKKPTRFLVFFFTISSLLILLILLFIIKLPSSSFNHQTNFHFTGNLSDFEVKELILSAKEVSKIEKIASIEKGLEKESGINEVSKGGILDDFDVEELILSAKEVSKIQKESGINEVSKDDNSTPEAKYSRKSQDFDVEVVDFVTERKDFSLGGVDNSSLGANYTRNSLDFDVEEVDFVTQSKSFTLGGVDNSSLEASYTRNVEDFGVDFVTHSKNFSLGGVDNSSLKANYSRNFEDFGVEEVRSSGNSGDLNSISSTSLYEQIGSSIDDKIGKKYGKSCDYSRGMWVFDESYPLYTNVSCPFIDEGFNCLANGRLDNEYMKWRWQPQGCDLPRFNATRMLELIRGKRLVFVGDSVNRNQWESLLCLLMGAIKDPKKVYEARGRRITKGKGNYSFKFVDYKCTVEFYVTHFLVHESKARIGRKRVQTLRIDTIDRGSSRWRGADILVFNTAHWWNHHKTKSGVNYYQEKDQVIPRLDVSDAFRRALSTWASWVDKNIRSQRTQVFFRSSAPAHFSGGQWNSGGHCKEASRPLDIISDTNYPERNRVVEAIISQMRTPVTYLNITSLSDYRIDGHPSTYGRMAGKRYSSGGEDCSHWCLPGVPDTWNQILYSHLLSKG